jgi:predicted RNA-binding Zn ribbon-like protein
MDNVFKRVAARLSLDFHNTASWVGDEVVGDEAIKSFSDIALWCREAGLLDVAQAQRLDRTALANPAQAEELLADARRLRSTLRLLFGAVAGHRPVPGDALKSLNVMLARLSLRLRADASAGRFEWDWIEDGENLDAILWPVIWDAAALLRDHNALQRVKSCAGDRCGWLFLDTSRRGNRRWCDMADCGNRAKVRRFHERHGRSGRGTRGDARGGPVE